MQHCLGDRMVVDGQGFEVGEMGDIRMTQKATLAKLAWQAHIPVLMMEEDREMSSVAEVVNHGKLEAVRQASKISTWSYFQRRHLTW